MRNYFILLLSIFFFRSNVFAQIDTIEKNPVKSSDSLSIGSTWRPNLALQITYTTLGFFSGFAVGGIQHMIDEANGKEPRGSLWPFITPFTTSLGCHLAGTDYFRREGGSYVSGVAAGFLGELVGVGLNLAISQNDKLHSSPYIQTLTYYLPVVSLTILFYNLGKYEEENMKETNNIYISPWYHDGAFGAYLKMSY